jgi:pyruvate kinase
MISRVTRLGRTKIVCTIGPASGSASVLRKMVLAGMDVARLNFSHGTHEEHLAVIQRVRQVSERSGQPVAILQDLSGAKIRVGEIEHGECEIAKNAELILTTRRILGNARRVSVSRESLPREVKPGEAIFLNDGAIRLRVKEVVGKEIVCKVLAGGVLGSRKGINLPETDLRLRALTEKDKADLRFGIANDVDLVALSFVRRAADVRSVRKIVATSGKDISIVAKIEKRMALENLEGIVREADGIMVARGDLGVETDLERVPLVQKHIIRLCNRTGKPVITATQMLESMVTNPIPTRAEVTDVANAILDGTDAVMLSEETAVGKYPLRAVQMMSRVATQTESELPTRNKERISSAEEGSKIPDAIAQAAATMAEEIGVKAIMTCTMSGGTARLIARYRPRVPILAASPLPETIRRLCLTWGVFPLQVEMLQESEETVAAAAKAFAARRVLRSGDRVVVVAGIAPETPGGANLIRVIEV